MTIEDQNHTIIVYKMVLFRPDDILQLWFPRRILILKTSFYLLTMFIKAYTMQKQIYPIKTQSSVSNM